jgi:signal transduction histidine kinase
VSISIFRVLQEALTNVMRHAKASKVEIRLSHADSALQVTISDNGVGMRQSSKSDLKSLGIVGMKERIARTGGVCNFFSEPGKGTRLEIIIPVSQ